MYVFAERGPGRYSYNSYDEGVPLPGHFVLFNLVERPVVRVLGGAERGGVITIPCFFASVCGGADDVDTAVRAEFYTVVYLIFIQC